MATSLVGEFEYNLQELNTIVNVANFNTKVAVNTSFAAAR